MEPLFIRLAERNWLPGAPRPSHDPRCANSELCVLTRVLRSSAAGILHDSLLDVEQDTNAATGVGSRFHKQIINTSVA